MNAQPEELIVLLDADGVLLDTTGLVENIAPRIYRLRGSKFYDLGRKLVILFGGNKVVDDRLPDMPNVKGTLFMLMSLNKNIRLGIITKRPFCFGGKNKLLKQLDAKYPGYFNSENVFSSFFSRDKAKVVKEKIWQPGMRGFIIDDNDENLANMPENIQPVWLTSSDVECCDSNIIRITKFEEILNLV